MLLLLARHGNTFEAGDRAVWVGARTDLPLTEHGKEQARRLGEALRPIRPRLKRVLSGPLQRTREHAEIVAAALGFDAGVESEERLREIDYGLWEGKSSQEIVALGAEAELKAWNEHGDWPASADWKPSASVLIENAATIAADLAADLADDEAALLVTSNGVLRFFLKLATGAWEERQVAHRLKVGTGHCCALSGGAEGWRLIGWDCEPNELAFS